MATQLSEKLKKLLFAKPMRIVGSVSIGVVIAWFLSSSSLGRVTELNAIDIQFKLARKTRLPESSIVILTIDQNSLQYFKKNGRVTWPWPRDFYAITTDYLSQSGAKAIVYDFHFNEPDIDRVGSSGIENDSLFANSMHAAGNVYLSAQLTKKEAEDQPGDTIVQFPSEKNYLNIPHEYSFDKTYAPLIPFQKAAKEIGVVNFNPDEDGVFRRMPLVYKYFNWSIFTLSYSVFRNLGDRQNEETNIQFPFLVYWYGKGGPTGVFKYYSIHAVIVSAIKQAKGLIPDIPPESFKNKIIFIGSNAPGLLDFRTTPFTSEEPYPGVEIHATVLSNLMNRDFIVVVPMIWIFFICVLLAVIVSVVSNFSQNIIYSLAVAIVLLAGYFFIVAKIFSSELILLKVVFPMSSVILTFIISLGWSYATEGRSRRQIQKIFGQYVNPHVVKQLAANPESSNLAGEEIDATVMFSDIEGFTTISESKKPKELVQFLNEYFSTATDIFLKHDGTVDKFIGDAVMVLFGAPVKQVHHHLTAARAAYEFSKVVAAMKKEALLKGEPVFSTRIGINSGPMVVGSIGGRKTKLEYTAIGDTVNQASRLEGVNKFYGTSIMMSENTAQHITDEFLLREMDLIKVKGKLLPTKIYELVCKKEEITETHLRYVQTFESALQLYRHQQWNDAITMFQTVLKLKEDDAASKVYIQRCEEFINDNPPADWDGVYTMTSK